MTNWSNRWFISDTHFSHANMLKFTDKDGVRVRGMWETAEEMDDALVSNWNSVVGPTDIIYHLGDVAIPRRGLKVLARCNGRKRLVKGNHDIFKLKDYLPYFEDIHGCIVFTPKQVGVKIACTHVPIHRGYKDRWDANVHGHMHTNNVMMRNWYGKWVQDPEYINVSVEQINFTPIHFDDILARVKK